MARLKTLDHGTLLRAKNVMDEAMPDLERAVFVFRSFVP